MYRTHHCGELRAGDAGKKVRLCGWVQRSRDLGGMTFVDLRDRYGITQLLFNMDINRSLCMKARKLGREFVISIAGEVSIRSSKNPNLPTGDIEIMVDKLEVLNEAKVPPFTIEDETDGGEDLRMKYRYLDLRRRVVRKNLELRHRMAQETRKYMDSRGFLEVETPTLIKSTPEGARDFVVPSRMNPHQFYALPQSPQTFKQLLMVAGFDRYFQIVKCFRDEDLRADRQPEFTQIDVEMAFVERDDVLEAIEGLASHLFKTILDKDVDKKFIRMPYDQAMEKYGTDKPDLRFGMMIGDLTEIARDKGFRVFDQSEYVGGISVPGCAGYSRKQLDELTDFVTRPQIGAAGLIHVKCLSDGTYKSSADKFFGEEEFRAWADKTGAAKNDLLLVLAGKKSKTLKALGELRLEMGRRLGLRKAGTYVPLWIVDFPIFEWDEEEERYHAMHHPFTAPRTEDLRLFEEDPGKVRANAYDLVINGVEIGGGSIRIHDEQLQQTMFRNLGLTREEAREKFGFLMDAFRYGAPPHGGIAFGFDRWVSLFAGLDSIRDVIAFPKNNSGRDVMIDSPSALDGDQLNELHIRLVKQV